VASTTRSHLAPRLKKEYNYTSAPPPGLHGLSRVKCTFLPFKTYFIPHETEKVHNSDNTFILKDGGNNSRLEKTAL
jgi:hypothetical protein